MTLVLPMHPEFGPELPKSLTDGRMLTGLAIGKGRCTSAVFHMSRVLGIVGVA